MGGLALRRVSVSAARTESTVCESSKCLFLSTRTHLEGAFELTATYSWEPAVGSSDQCPGEFYMLFGTETRDK